MNVRKRRKEAQGKWAPSWVAFLTWEAEKTIDSPWREVTFGINFRFSRSSWWQATTWYRRTWGIRPCRYQSWICKGRSEGSCQKPSLGSPTSLPHSGPRVGLCSGQSLFRQEGECDPDSCLASTWDLRVERNLGFLWSSILQHVARTPSPMRWYLNKSFLVKDTGKHCIREVPGPDLNL